MNVLLLFIVLPCLVGYAESNCMSQCTQTDYRGYSNCVNSQCPNTVVATGCPESSCESINCNTCSGSNPNACCQSCCRQSNCQCTSVNCNTCTSSNTCCNTCCTRAAPQCKCDTVNCNSCQGYGSCCQSCCKQQQQPPQQDCCQNSNRQQCCNTNPNNSCCTSPPQPLPQPIIPSITLPNITIFINQTPAVIYNTPNISINTLCGQRNSSHIVGCSNPIINQSCCRIPYRPPCYQTPNYPYQQCPPVGYRTACGPQCIQYPQVIQQPPMVIQPPPPPPPPPQPIVIRPPPVIQPPPQPIVIRPPPVIQQPPQQPIVIRTPPVIQPQGCYVNYQYNQCPSYCVGGCSYMPPPQVYDGCSPINSWPFMRCPDYYGGYGYGSGSYGYGSGSYGYAPGGYGGYSPYGGYGIGSAGYGTSPIQGGSPVQVSYR